MATIDTYNPRNILSGDFPNATESGTIASGAGVVVPGTVLGRVSESGKLKAVDSTAEDGSNAPYGVYMGTESVDATSADVVGVVVYLTGQFNPEALVVGEGVVTDYAEDMRKVSLFQKPVSRN